MHQGKEPFTELEERMILSLRASIEADIQSLFYDKTCDNLQTCMSRLHRTVDDIESVIEWAATMRSIQERLVKDEMA